MTNIADLSVTIQTSSRIAWAVGEARASRRAPLWSPNGCWGVGADQRLAAPGDHAVDLFLAAAVDRPAWMRGVAAAGRPVAEVHYALGSRAIWRAAIPASH
jgi:hypothetical protein